MKQIKQYIGNNINIERNKKYHNKFNHNLYKSNINNHTINNLRKISNIKNY